MKKLLILLFIPILSFGQVHRPVRLSGNGIGNSVPGTVQRSARSVYTPPSSGVTPLDPNFDGKAIGIYDFTDPAFLTKDGSNRVSQVNDLSGTGHHLLQSQSENKPTFVDGGCQFSSSSGMISATFTAISQPTTVYIVVKQTGYVGIGNYFVNNKSGPTGQRFLGWMGNTFVLDAGSEDYVTTIPQVLNITVLYSAVFNGASSSISYNNTTITSFNPGGAPLNAIGLLYPYYGADIKYYYYIVRHNADDATIQANIRNWLYTKFGITP